MKMKTFIMANQEIYEKAIKLVNDFTIDNIALPIAACFSIEKNKSVLTAIAEDIERSRFQIIQRYGTLQDDGNFLVASDKIEEANEELSALLSIEQEIKIYTFKIEELKNVELTPSQMKAIMFMIDEGEEN